MRFTENEMTLAVRGAAKFMLGVAAAGEGADDGFDAEAGLEAMSHHERFEILSAAGDYVLSVLVALPDVAVEPGARPVFGTEVVFQVVDEVTRSEAERAGVPVDTDNFATAVVVRTAVVSAAVAALPTRIDPDALLTEADLDVTVPDTIEGL